jgi:hypothetical protein
MRWLLTFILITLCLSGFSFGLSAYMAAYRLTEEADYAAEVAILQQANAATLLSELQPYCRDTLPGVRQKAYYLAYKKALSNDSARSIGAKLLLQGIADVSGGIAGQVLRYLQEFSPTDFDDADRELIALRLQHAQQAHYRELALLAGFVGAGKDVLYRRWLDPELPQKTKWSIALALARMGSREHTEFCMRQAVKAPVNSRMVSYLLPDLIYTRQREAIDFCLNIIKSDKKDCRSYNPDLSGEILCGYRVMELLAPAMADFPVRVDAAGVLEARSYDEALSTVRRWMEEEKEYKVNTHVF